MRMSYQVREGSLEDGEVEFVDRGYGKNYVRLLHVTRAGLVHRVKEIEVNTQLRLDTTRDYVGGDNSHIVATDSQKNTVYALARKHGVSSIEEFAMLLCNHFLQKYNHVNRVRIHVEETPWKRHTVEGVSHGHAFVKALGEGLHVCDVTQHRSGDGLMVEVSSGIKDLTVLKTTQSKFVNFVDDEYRSLPDMEDRIFSTVIKAYWRYAGTDLLDFEWAREAVKSCIMEMFAGPPTTGIPSPSVQKTLYDAGKLALARVPHIDNIYIELPNVHMYPFDFGKLPALKVNSNEEVFIPTDKPSGNIRAMIRRKKSASSKL